MGKKSPVEDSGNSLFYAYVEVSMKKEYIIHFVVNLVALREPSFPMCPESIRRIAQRLFLEICLTS